LPRIITRSKLAPWLKTADETRLGFSLFGKLFDKIWTVFGYRCQQLLTVYQDKIHAWLEFLNITSYLLYILMKLLSGIGLNIAASNKNGIKKAI